MSEEYKNTPEDEDIPNIEESSLIGASDADQEKEDTSSLSRPEETSEKPSISVTENSSTDMASIVAAAASEAISAAFSAVHPQKDQTADLQLLSEQIAALKKEVSDLREELNASKADLESIKKSILTVAFPMFPIISCCTPNRSAVRRSNTTTGISRFCRP